MTRRCDSGGRRRLRTSIAAACTIFALKAGRNISLFGVVAWPLLTLHLAPDLDRWLAHSAVAKELARYDAARPAGRWSAAAFALLLGAGLLHGRVGPMRVVQDEVDPHRFPVAAVRQLQRARLEANLLTTWTWSGYVPYAWPGRRAYFDPLVFTPATLRTFGTMLLARPGWRRALDSTRTDVVIGPPHLPLVDSLRATREWAALFADSTAVVVRRVGAP